MKNFFAGATLLALAAASPAFAADLPARMPTKAPVAVAPVYNWSGWYVGLNAGGAFGRSNWSNGAATTGNFNVNGALVGGTLGVNWQAGQWVWGLEGDGAWANIKGSTTTACPLGCDTKSNFLATFRGRVGYAGFGPVLPYLTGGLAVGDIEARSSLGSSTTTRAGWTVGTGVEWAVVGPWTAKVEYLYADLGKASCSIGICSLGGSTDVKLTENVVRAGLNYRFGGAMR
ncbi:MAG: outer membrane protein [Pseudomonadota bacterium]